MARSVPVGINFPSDTEEEEENLENAPDSAFQSRRMVFRGDRVEEEEEEEEISCQEEEEEEESTDGGKQSSMRLLEMGNF